jgi:hypothetical protein
VGNTTKREDGENCIMRRFMICTLFDAKQVTFMKIASRRGGEQARVCALEGDKCA